jgi:hypothetical protein
MGGAALPRSPFGLAPQRSLRFLADEGDLLVVLPVDEMSRLRIAGQPHQRHAAVDVAALYRVGRRAGRPVRFPQ